MLRIVRMESTAEAEVCAHLMATSEPWVTLGRDHERSLAIIQDPTREAYVAYDGHALAGFMVLCLAGPLTGYIQTVFIAAEQRGRGLGRELIAFGETRIAGVSPNVFLCVSSFNPRARALYQRLGYEYIGELRDYLVRGHSELLFRKTVGPWAEFVAANA